MKGDCEVYHYMRFVYDMNLKRELSIQKMAISLLKDEIADLAIGRLMVYDSNSLSLTLRNSENQG